MNNMLIHEFIDLVQVEKGDHGVTVMLGVKVGVPEQNTNEQIGSNTACVEEAVGIFGDFTVGVLEVTDVVDDGVSNQNRDEPPKGESRKALACTANGGKNSNVDQNLATGGELEFVHDTALFAVVKILEAPTSTTVVDRNT